jgi:hypothetical protein
MSVRFPLRRRYTGSGCSEQPWIGCPVIYGGIVPQADLACSPSGSSRKAIAVRLICGVANLRNL